MVELISNYAIISDNCIFLYKDKPEHEKNIQDSYENIKIKVEDSILYFEGYKIDYFYNWNFDNEKLLANSLTEEISPNQTKIYKPNLLNRLLGEKEYEYVKFGRVERKKRIYQKIIMSHFKIIY